MLPQDVFDLARQYGIIKPRLVITYPGLVTLVRQAEAERADREALEAEADRVREEESWSRIDLRTDRQRDEDERAAAEEAWMLGR